MPCLRMVAAPAGPVRASSNFLAASADGAALWSTLVDLVGVHERAYLEHCRRHALKGSR